MVIILDGHFVHGKRHGNALMEFCSKGGEASIGLVLCQLTVQSVTACPFRRNYDVSTE